MKRIRTTLAPNAPWPRPHDWPKITRPVVEHAPAEPRKKAKPKAKAKPAAKPKACDVSEALKSIDGVFHHPLNKARARAGMAPVKDLELDQSKLLDKARKQLERPETRHSVRKTVHLNLRK